MNHAQRTLVTLAASLILATCSSSSVREDVTAPAERMRVGIAAIEGGEVELQCDSPGLTTGLSRVYLVPRKTSGEPLEGAALELLPVMSMTGGMQHGAPVMSPPAREADGAFGAEVVFQMPTSAMGTWGATVRVQRPGWSVAEAVFPPFSVTDSGRAKVFSSTGSDGTLVKYVVSLNFVSKPRVGLSPIVVTLHTMQDAMTFAPVDDATLSVDPQMPSMGHGSPGSVNPVQKAPGRYEGELSLSMAGPWETTLTVTRGGVVVGKPVFAVEF